MNDELRLFCNSVSKASKRLVVSYSSPSTGLTSRQRASAQRRREAAFVPALQTKKSLPTRGYAGFPCRISCSSSFRSR